MNKPTINFMGTELSFFNSFLTLLKIKTDPIPLYDYNKIIYSLRINTGTMPVDDLA